MKKLLQYFVPSFVNCGSFIHLEAVSRLLNRKMFEIFIDSRSIQHSLTDVSAFSSQNLDIPRVKDTSWFQIGCSSLSSAPSILLSGLQVKAKRFITVTLIVL